MKVEIKLLPEAEEPYAVICTREVTSEIRRAAELLEKENPGVIPVKENDRIVLRGAVLGRAYASCSEERLQGVHLAKVFTRFQKVFRIIRRRQV